MAVKAHKTVRIEPDKERTEAGREIMVRLGALPYGEKLPHVMYGRTTAVVKVRVSNMEVWHTLWQFGEAYIV